MGFYKEDFVSCKLFYSTVSILNGKHFNNKKFFENFIE
jgi:hypothetical protein